MIDHHAIHLAARAKALTLSVAVTTDTFARASSATYVDGNNLLATVGNDIYRGFTEASGATNLLTAPNDFTNAAWRRTDVGASFLAVNVVGTVTGPDGTASATEFNTHAYQDITAAGTNTLSGSVFLKKGTSSVTDLSVRSGAVTASTGQYIARVTWNGDGTIASLTEMAGPANGTITQIAALASGWYRIGITFSPGTDAVRSFGVSSASGSDTAIASRLMLESGASVTSYTPDTRASESGSYLGLAATATGYTRASGSFLTDGFRVGMEVTPTGFTQTSAATITAVTALTMTVKGGRTVQAIGSNRSLAATLPTVRGYENLPITPVANEPYCEEEYLPGGMGTATLGNFGTLEATPTYVLRLYGPQRTGMDALRRTADALLTLFAPTTPITVAGHTVRVRSDVAPTPSPLGQTEDGWAVITVSIPLRVHTANSR